MRRWAKFVVRRRWWVLGATLLLLPLLAAIAAGTPARLSVTEPTPSGAESTNAAAAIAAAFPQAGQSDFVLVVTARRGTVDAEAVAREGTRLTEQLAASDGVTSASSYWTLGRVAQLRSRNSGQALVVASLAGTERERIETAGALSERFTVATPALSTRATGKVEVTRQVTEQAESDLRKTEAITAPITLLALIVVFGSIVAAFLPLAVAVLAIVCTLVVLSILTGFLDVTTFALNLTTALGLGLAVDYSLFVASRYREELETGAPTAVAIGRSLQTAGRTVAFSAMTVLISMSALLVFPVPYLQSFAYAGMSVVAFSALASIVVLPAILAVLGPRIDRFRIMRPRSGEHGLVWKHQAERVMRHPVPYAVGVSLLLVLLAVPFLSLRSGLLDDRVVPPSVSSRAAIDDIRRNFSSRESSALPVSLPDLDVVTDSAAIDRYARALAAVPGVVRVDAATGYYLVTADGVAAAPPTDLSDRFRPRAGASGTWLSVVPDVEPVSAEGERLVRAIRAVPVAGRVAVGGESAALVDTKAVVAQRLPWALGIIVIVTFVLLFLMTGSLLVPLKALALNVLSLTATFGAMVWIFQEGHLSGVLGFTPTGTIDVFTPILMFCISFGLSMDYEVFLISRIKEEYDLERDNEHAVAVGLQKTGRIVTAAALLLTLVFAGLATSQVAAVKLLGVGLGLAVLSDAFLIRGTLVPAFMRLAGRSNWWSPRPLRRWHLRWGIWENEPVALLDREFASLLPDHGTERAPRAPAVAS
ncbi:MAG: MMPL family transporter [Actinomycetes bacterium]